MVEIGHKKARLKETKNCHVTTFYSYKGGVGRTLALANVGALLAQTGAKVLLWDLDLEAPGIQFVPGLRPERFKRNGFLEWLVSHGSKFADNDSAVPRSVFEAFDRAILPSKVYPQNLHLLPAFGANGNPAALYGSVDWSWWLSLENDGNRKDYLFPAARMFKYLFAHLEKDGYDHILVDARTGLTDLGGLLSFIVSHATVLVTNLNEQNREGLMRVWKAMEPARSGEMLIRSQFGREKLKTWFVFSQIPSQLAVETDQRIARWQASFANNFSMKTVIVYDGALPLEESLKAISHPDSSVGRSYSNLARRIDGWRHECMDLFDQTRIVVLGIGGAGGNAVEHMIRTGMQGVDFVCANTDKVALKRSSAGTKILFGEGLGAGGKPSIARELALLHRSQIAEALSGAQIVFITAGMGGGTGTGAAPIVAEVARELGILTVAVVTKPFEYEGKRKRLAEVGVTELACHVDSLIVILNEKLGEMLGDEVSMLEAFKAADRVMSTAVGAIAEIINVPGLVNVDFEDVRAAMGGMGKAMVGSETVAGIDRARIAAEMAVACPLFEDGELASARGVLVSITANDTMGLKEYKEVMMTIRQYTASEATVICGAVFDETMEDKLRVTVVGTGLGTYTAGKKSIKNGPKMRLASTNHDTSSKREVDEMTKTGLDKYDIPAFLRRQSD